VKLTELIAETTQLTVGRSEIEEWLRENSIYDYRINDDLTVDIRGDLIFNFSQIKRIPFQFGIVSGKYVCAHRLLTLEGSPRRVEGDLSISHISELTSLKGAPEYVGRDLIFGNCHRVKSLVGAPKEIGGDFTISNASSLESLAGFPAKMSGDFSFTIPDNGMPLLELLHTRGLVFAFLAGSHPKLKLLREIINDALAEPYGNKRIIECQNKLIDAGLEVFADFGEEL
jgi:hypothetical protein